MVSQISGKFVNDTLEGEVNIHYFDGTMMKGFAQSGHVVGLQRFFDLDESVLTNLTDTQTKKVYLRQWNYEGKSISVIGCQNKKVGKRCIVLTKDIIENIKSCLVVMIHV